MILNYKINKENHYITFCKSNKLGLISKSIEKIHSDKNILFIFDSKVETRIVDLIHEELKLSGCNIYTFSCEGGKVNKNKKLLFKIIVFLIEKKFTKKSIIISFGGGVVGDVSALAASLYLRGLYYYCIPSTMTSIVDSSIGGKTAINYRKITNSVGTYYHPKNIFILEQVILNLPDREFFSGFAEVIKCGLIDKNNILKYLIKHKKNLIKRNFSNLTKICSLALKKKLKFFLDDIYEKDSRLMLNFGHTFAHAIEMAVENNSKEDFIRHGEAVGLGILCELFYASKSKTKLYYSVHNLLKEFYLPTSLDLQKIKINSKKIQNDIYKNIFLDKKRIDKYPRYINIKNIGEPSIREIKDFDFLNDVIIEIIK